MTPLQSGAEAAREGLPLSENPHPAGTQPHTDWERGYLGTEGGTLSVEPEPNTRKQ